MYHQYFNLLLEVEDELVSRIRQLEYSEKSRTVYSSKLSLLLLQTCPIIESYMAYLATESDDVRNHPLYNWEYNWKLWESNKEIVKVKNGLREIQKFPKFSYVSEKVFSLSSLSVNFFHTERFQDIQDNDKVTTFTPFSSLKKFSDYSTYSGNGGFPVGLDTPKWWTAYNKIKHSLVGQANNRVTYSLTVEAISGLFILLAYCAPDLEILEKHGYIKNGAIRTKLFKAFPQK